MDQAMSDFQVVVGCSGSQWRFPVHILNPAISKWQCQLKQVQGARGCPVIQ